MRSIAYLTTSGLVEFPICDRLTEAPLRTLGFDVENVEWRADEDWDRFVAVLPRSTWDYHLHPGDFFDVLERIQASGARLFNELEVMRWNADKSYLGELRQRGLTVVPTGYGGRLDREQLVGLHAQFGDDLVVKPRVGASAEDTFLLRRDTDPGEAIAALEGRDWLAQPFMPAVVEEGEFSLVYFDGEFSHALLKIPRRGDFRVQENWGGTTRAVDPEELLLRRGQEVLRALPGDLLYARIDLVRDGDDFALMEAELIEPSLYLNTDPGAAGRFARALAGRLGSGA